MFELTKRSALTRGPPLTRAVLWPSTSKENAISRRSITLFFVIVGAAVALGYATGLLETLGYESQTVRGGFGRTTRGLSVGTKTMYLRAGHAFFVDYDAHVDTGALYIALTKCWAPGEEKTRFSHHVKETSSGQLVFPITESGWYEAIFDGSVLGHSPPGSGYDVSYTLRWGVR
jgi:hypothetical protein